MLLNIEKSGKQDYKRSEELFVNTDHVFMTLEKRLWKTIRAKGENARYQQLLKNCILTVQIHYCFSYIYFIICKCHQFRQTMNYVLW